MLSQNKEILEHLKKGKSITAIEALRRFNCFRLSARIYDLRRMGHKIMTMPYRTTNGKNIAEYLLSK